MFVRMNMVIRTVICIKGLAVSTEQSSSFCFFSNSVVNFVFGSVQ